MFGFAGTGLAQWIPVVLGASAILYSLVTRYELGFVGLISMPIHLWLDGFSGVLLAASPWLFGFSEVVWLPHLLFGLLEIAVALTSETISASDRMGITVP
jgi:hypothetical protein